MAGRGAHVRQEHQRRIARFAGLIYHTLMARGQQTERTHVYNFYI